LDIDLRYGAEIMQTIADTQARFRAILSRAGIRATLECPIDELTPGSAAHFGGAARMHALPEYGVLDGWSRLHEAPNVAVVDASSFTTAVEKNPTLTAMALAARAAEHFADDIAGPPSDSLERYSDAVSAIR
jgi:choline dehydrogenase-like flavoprotein